MTYRATQVNDSDSARRARSVSKPHQAREARGVNYNVTGVVPALLERRQYRAPTFLQFRVYFWRAHEAALPICCQQPSSSSRLTTVWAHNQQGIDVRVKHSPAGRQRFARIISLIGHVLEAAGAMPG
jgi:hypothetical protein